MTDDIIKTRNYSAFDARLTHSALNARMFLRLLRWLAPYRLTLFISIVFVLISAAVNVLQPVVIGRVVIDGIILPGRHATRLPAYGMAHLVHELSCLLGGVPLLASVIVYASLVLLSAATMYVHRLTLSYSVLQALRDLRVDLFTKLETKPMSFYDHVAVGRLMTRIGNDVENLIDLLTGFGMLMGELVPFALALILMFSISPKLTGAMMIAIPVAVTITILFRRVIGDVYRNTRNSVSNLNQFMQESLIGMEVVQLSGRETINAGQYDRLNSANKCYQFQAVNYETFYGAFNNSLSGFAIALIVWYGGGGVVQGQVSLGSMVLFVQLINMMINPIVSVGSQFNTLFRAMASGERIFQAIDWDESTKEPENPLPLPRSIHGELEFRHLTFCYYDGEPVLHDISCTVRAGEKLAVVGPTGAGKSTIIKLLARFYDFDDGCVFLDGIDVNCVGSADLRKRIGIVLQDFHIFSGTVLDNITLNNPDIPNERAMEAARLVSADRFIEALPQGYDTFLSERGQNLSQGQRQLLAFARVLAADPEILVLDEATANIDTATELVIQDALHEVLRGRTSIIIAHRLQTIEECDRVLVLHHGRIAEYGTQEELLRRDGIYYTLHQLQFQDSRVAAEIAGETTAKPRAIIDVPEEPEDEPEFPDAG